ncbi:MAG: bifunctional UDP-3-O-[3-hydroxymyristoyl] N-acetylglucosamine deacetylase/3-hydroxyacyl-ACP dehydratase [Candidatus Neomarinimicrobiota bacterium]
MISISNNFQKTITKEISFEGIGLHSGVFSKLILKPAPADFGIKFYFGDTIIPALTKYVDSTVRGTNLQKNDKSIMTIEHLLSALYALEIDNLKIEVSDLEIPILDGTAQIFTREIKRNGIAIHNKNRKEFIVDKLISFKTSKGVQFHLLPYDGYKFTYHLEYKNIEILNQNYTIELEQNNYFDEIASCKTFCLLSELLLLYEQNLIKGGSLKNAVVYVDKKLNKDQEQKINELFNTKIDYDKAILSNIDSISDNEAAKHKLLDLIGDSYLLGFRIRGHLIASKSGHESNIEFIKYLHNNFLNSNLHKEKKVDNMYDINQILDIMPHRYPFLLVDKVLHLEPGKSVSAIKNVTINEPFFVGHFPGKPVVPGVLLLEIIAQAGGFLVLHSIDEPNKKLIYLSSIKSAKFKEVAKPGDQLLVKAELAKFKLGTCKINGKIFVNDKLITECELLASVVRR